MMYALPFGSARPNLRRECDMKDQQEEQQPCMNEDEAAMDKCQRRSERRSRKCEGYCYIEMVGWMDRREKCRRDDDRFNE